MRPEDVATTADVERLAALLLGPSAARAPGVVHVASVGRGPGGGPRCVLHIHPGSPRSSHDRFLLGLARARAEAVLTSGRILREEPRLTHGLPGPPGLRRALAAWRREALGLEEPPWLLVLSTGRELSPGHHAFDGATRALLLVPQDADATLEARFAGRARVLRDAAPGARRALERLEEIGAGRITVEAGPTAAGALYHAPVRVDALWLATFEDALPPDAVGPAFPDAAVVEESLPVVSEPYRAVEPSGRWRFERRSREGPDGR